MFLDHHNTGISMKLEKRLMELTTHSALHHLQPPFGLADHARLLSSFELHEEWPLPAPHSRLRHTIYKCDTYELVLMYWGDGSSSSIHGHGGSDCSMRVLKGEIVEKRYRNFSTTIESSRQLRAGDVSMITDELGFHSLHAHNLCVTLHLYAKPLTIMQVYHAEAMVWISQPALSFS